MGLIDVIIPVLNEEQNLLILLPQLRTENVARVIVVDGGSTDGSRSIAEHHGAHVIQSSPGRSKQLNNGAASSTSPILYFLHADSFLPGKWDESIKAAISRGHDAGCFSMTWNDGHCLLRLMAWFTRFFGGRFRGGDQSLFISREHFDVIGGYAKMPIFEDVEIVSRIRRNGRFTVLRGPIVTSARKYRQVGIWKLHMHYLVLHTMYRLGCPIEKISARYEQTIGRHSWT